MARRKARKSANDGPTRLVGYTRVSSEQQAREGASLAAQSERLQAFAIAHCFELVGIEEDAGISGKVAPADRPGMARALEMVHKGEADGIVALKLDRLSRSTRDVLDLVENCDQHGWRLISVSENLDSGSASGRLVITILGALSQMEREVTGERTTFALESIARQGRGRSRFVPFGWRSPRGGIENEAGDDRRLVPHCQEQAALTRILKLREEGYGARRIASALEGTNPRSRRPWTSSGIASILRRIERWERAGVAPLALSNPDGLAVTR